MDTVNVLWAIASVFFVVIGVLVLVGFVAVLLFLRELHKELVRARKQGHEDVSVILEALNAIADASETTASTVKAAAEDDDEEEKEEG
jgi:predicted RNA-binding Zn ribbon-like protein